MPSDPSSASADSALFSAADLVSFGKEAASHAAMACALRGDWPKVAALLDAGCPIGFTRDGSSLGSIIWRDAPPPQIRSLAAIAPALLSGPASFSSSALFLSVAKGDMALFSEALAASIRDASQSKSPKRALQRSLNAVGVHSDGSRLSPLSLACHLGEPEMAKSLLSAGANPSGDSEMVPPLFCALASPSEHWREGFEALLAAGADPDAWLYLERAERDAPPRLRGGIAVPGAAPLTLRHRYADLPSVAALIGCPERLEAALAARSEPLAHVPGYPEDLHGSALHIATLQNRPDLLAILLRGREPDWHKGYLDEGKNDWHASRAEDGDPFSKARLSDPRAYFSGLLLSEAAFARAPDSLRFWARQRPFFDFGSAYRPRRLEAAETESIRAALEAAALERGASLPSKSSPASRGI